MSYLYERYFEEDEYDWYEEYVREGEEIERYLLWHWEEVEDRLASPFSHARLRSWRKTALSKASVSGFA